MKITKDIISRKRIRKGSYLALASMNMYCESNRNIPVWWVVDSQYLQKNAKSFQGWVRIDELTLKFHKGKSPLRHFLEVDGKPQYCKQSDYTTVNILLVLFKGNERGWNLCHPYGISNAAYYNLHRDEFDGWIDLEDIAIDLRLRENSWVCESALR